MNKVIWKYINNDLIIPDRYMISSNIEFKDIKSNFEPMIYHSSNGYDFVLLELNEKTLMRYDKYESELMLFRIDLLVADTFIPIPKELIGKKLDVEHIDGDTHNCNVDNLKWIEDIEIWKPITYNNITQNKYKISSHGHVKLIKDESIHPFYINHSGYLVTTLTTVNPRKSKNDYKYDTSRFVHRLVTHEFYGDSDLQVNHINGIKFDNHYKNLEYTTGYENRRHAMITHLRYSEMNQNDLDMIYTLLERYRSTDVVYEMIYRQYPHITHHMIHDVKGGRYDHRVDFSKHRKLPAYRIHVDEIDMIRDKLIEYNGNSKKVYQNLHDDYPFISLAIIHHIKLGKDTYQKSLKYDMSFNNGRFPYMIERSN